MKIFFNNINSNNNIKNRQLSTQVPYVSIPIFVSKQDSVTFTGAKPKRLNIEVEKQKLLKSINKILETNPSNKKSKFDKETLSMRELMFLDAKDRKMDFLLEQTSIMSKHSFANPTMMYEMRQRLWNEAKKTNKDANNYKSKVRESVDVSQTNESWDYALLNKFKSACLNNNFDFGQIIQEHYSMLSRLNKVEDAKKSYPNIKPITTPEEVVVQNIMKGLDRDFYEEADKLYLKDDLLGVAGLYTKVLMNACVYLTQKYDLFYKHLPSRISTLFSNKVSEKYHQCVEQNSFSSIPQYIKKLPQIATQLDLDLMQIDFEKFVLDVYKQQFVDMKKLNDIVYEENGIKIPVKKLANTPYKFEKMSEKFRAFIKDAERIKQAQRDYDNFTVEELKSRLNYFSNHPACEDDVIFESIMDFYSSAFLPDDITNLKILLKDLDHLVDKKKPLVQVVSDIQNKKIRPVGTHKLNEIERKEAFEKVKAEQQKAYELLAIQDEYDKVVNTFYTLEMNTVATACSDFRPQSLDDINDIERAKFLIKYVNDNLINNKTPNHNKIEQEIFYWNAYYQYKFGSDYIKHPKYKELISNAEKYAIENNEINPIKAGQYIFNMEILSTYPESADVMDEPEILHRIVEKTGNNKQKALKYLVKYDEYKNLFPEEQLQINAILGFFDIKDSVEKALVKQIVETSYLENDTHIQMIDSKNGESHVVKIAKEAKQQIYDKHKFPSCLDYFEAFETASQTFVGDVGSSGVKRMGGNNQALQYKYEVKIKGYPDRLFSSKNDYRFDVYSEKGLH